MFLSLKDNCTLVQNARREGVKSIQNSRNTQSKEKPKQKHAFAFDPVTTLESLFSDLALTSINTFTCSIRN